MRTGYGYRDESDVRCRTGRDRAVQRMTTGHQKKVIFVGAHPDDIELGCGAAVFRFVQAGFDVHCYYLTRGEKSGEAERRQAESRNALRVLGVASNNIYFPPDGMFEDTMIPHDHRTIEYIESSYLQSDAECNGVCGDVYAAFIHSDKDRHQDHQIASKCGVSAFRRVARVYTFESPSSTNDFHPNMTIGFSDDVLELKRKALNCHESQRVLNRWYFEYEAMMGVAAFRGRHTRLPFAESFEVLWEEFDPAAPV